jgi:hypothetical protein
MLKPIYHTKAVSWLMLLFFFILFAINAKSQDETERYSRNFKFFGTIVDKETGKPMANTCFVVYGLNQSRFIKTNEKGEYEVQFYDKTFQPLNDNYNLKEDEILIGWCEDPNKIEIVSLKKTRVKKTSNRDDFSKKPIVIKLDIKLEYDI